MFEFLALKPEAFGLDISNLSLKIIKLKKEGKLLDLACFGEIKIKPGIIEEGEIKDEKSLVKIIKEGVSKVKGETLKTKYVIVSLPEEKAFLEVIQMPKMKKEELEKAVYFEAENYVPLPIDQVYLDSQIVPPVYDHLDHLDVLIAALPKKTVDPYVSVFKKAGLIPCALEIESQAIARCLIKNGVSPFPVLLIDLGLTRTSFIIFSGYSLRFTSSIPISAQGLTEIIAKALKIDLKKAEDLKRKYGLETRTKPARNASGVAKAGGKEGGKVFDALIPSLTDLAEQTQKYIAFYQSHASHEHLPPNGKGVEKIELCGGGANLKGLTDFLSQELKIPVEIGNPWINILAKPPKEILGLSFKKSLSYATALGLALRGINE